MPYVRIDGNRIFYEVRGSGEPLVLNGSFTAGHFFFDKIKGALAKSHKLVMWEPRGLGSSDHPTNIRYSAELWADDLHELLGKLGVNRFHLAGFAFGTYIAVTFAAKYPERVASLLTYTDVYSRDKWKGYAKIWSVYRVIIQNFGTKGLGAKMIALMLGTSNWEEEMVDKTVDPKVLNWTVGYGCARADIRRYVQKVKKNNIPWAVIMGDRDWSGNKCKPEDDPSWMFMKRVNPEIKLFVVKNSHPAAVIMDRPKESCRIINAWLRENAISASVKEQQE